jgi:hypothetical protein
MQYVQRRLQRSVRDTRKSVAVLPNVSTSIAPLFPSSSEILRGKIPCYLPSFSEPRVVPVHAGEDPERMAISEAAEAR